MFGTYQSSELRIEVAASKQRLEELLTQPASLKKLLWPQQLDVATNDAASMLLGQTFESSVGPVKLIHTVEFTSAVGIRFLLSGSVDGFHEWQWGDGWVQSRLEGVSLLPLKLAHTASLLRLRQLLAETDKSN